MKQTVLEGRKEDHVVSELIWRKEEPSPRDFSLCRKFLTRLVPTNRLNPSVGVWINKPHLHGKWFYDEAKEEVIFVKNGYDYTIFVLENQECKLTEEKRFRYDRKVSSYNKPNREVKVTWNGANPSLIGIEVYDVELVSREKKKNR